LILDASSVVVAPKSGRLSDKELEVVPDCEVQRGFLASDDVSLDAFATTATLIGRTKSRQTVVSRDWVHVAHTPAHRRWRVRATKAAYEFGSVLVGVTEAQSFADAGRSIFFDLAGNVRFGSHPLDTLLCYTKEEVEASDSAIRYHGLTYETRLDLLEVEVDLSAQRVVLRNRTAGGEVHVNLRAAGEEWRSARLAVSLLVAGDAAELQL
jgi:hypothetical protein